MDNLDHEILKILIKNSRVPFSRIGKKLGISADVVKQRFKEIQDRNPNLKSTIILDPKKMGFRAIIIFNIKLKNRESIGKILTKIIKYPKTCSIINLIGDYDFLFSIYAVDFEDIHDTMQYLEEIEEISEIDIQFTYNNEMYDSPFVDDLLIHEII